MSKGSKITQTERVRFDRNKNDDMVKVFGITSEYIEFLQVWRNSVLIRGV